MMETKELVEYQRAKFRRDAGSPLAWLRYPTMHFSLPESVVPQPVEDGSVWGLLLYDPKDNSRFFIQWTAQKQENSFQFKKRRWGDKPGARAAVNMSGFARDQWNIRAHPVWIKPEASTVFGFKVAVTAGGLVAVELSERFLLFIGKGLLTLR